MSASNAMQQMMQHLRTPTHEAVMFNDGPHRHIYRWPRGQSPIPLAAVLGIQTARGQIDLPTGLDVCRELRIAELQRTGKLAELRDYLDWSENQ